MMVDGTSQDFNVADSSGRNEPSAKKEQHIVNRNMVRTMDGEKRQLVVSELRGGLYRTERGRGYISRHTIDGENRVSGKLFNGDADPDTIREFFGLKKGA